MQGRFWFLQLKIVCVHNQSKTYWGCPNTCGFIQLEGCFLRYYNRNFYNDPQNGKNAPRSVHCNTGNISQPQQFTIVVKALLSNITAKAAESPKLFVADSVTVLSSLTGNIYSLAQRWRDLSQTSYGSCLSFALEYIFSCQFGALGAQFGSRNYYLRYEIYKFFNTSILLSSPTQSPLVSFGIFFHIFFLP